MLVRSRGVPDPLGVHGTQSIANTFVILQNLYSPQISSVGESLEGDVIL